MGSIFWGIVFLISVGGFFLSANIVKTKPTRGRRISYKPPKDPAEDVKFAFVLLSLGGMVVSCLGAGIQVFQILGIHSGSIILVTIGGGTILYFALSITSNILKKRAAEVLRRAEEKAKAEKEARERPLKERIAALERMGQNGGISELELQDLRNTWLQLEPTSEWVNDDTQWQEYLGQYNIKVTEPLR